MTVIVMWSITSVSLALAPPNPPVLEGTAPDPGVQECGAPKPEWIFCSGFEEGNFSIWDDYDGNPPETNQLISHTGPTGRTGNHVAKLRVPPGRGGADFIKVLPGGFSKLYTRWYMQWEPGYDFSTRNHGGGGLHAGDRSLLGRSGNRPEGNDWFSAFVEPETSNKRLNLYSYYRGMYMDCADPNGSCWGDHLPCMLDDGSHYCTKPGHQDTVAVSALQAGKWYCFELMMDGGDASLSLNNANGSMNFWIDGQSIGPWTNLWMRTDPGLTFNILSLKLFFHDNHGPEGVLYDDVVVSTSRIGCYQVLQKTNRSTVMLALSLSQSGYGIPQQDPATDTHTGLPYTSRLFG